MANIGELPCCSAIVPSPKHPTKLPTLQTTASNRNTAMPTMAVGTVPVPDTTVTNCRACV